MKRSSLADANKQRPARIFSETYFKLLHRLEAELPRQLRTPPGQNHGRHLRAGV